MKVFFDTNVIIDAITSRDYNYRDSQLLVIKAARKEIIGYISAKQITDIYYILRKYVSDELKRRIVVKQLCDTFEILPLLPADISYCISSEISDYEDAIIDEAAKVYCIPYIVTHDIKHFKNASTLVMSPHDLLNFIETNDLV